MVLIITYAHKNQFKDYSSFFQAIKSNSNEWWHFMDSTWIVTTHHSANEFAHLLYPHILNSDFVLVAKLAKDFQGWLPREAWDWLNSKIY